MYLLADGIYPEYKIFMSTLLTPRGKNAKRFAAVQEASLKSVKRVFEVLIKRSRVVQRPFRLGFSSDMQKVMQACCMTYNMLIEDHKEWFVGSGVGVLRQSIADGQTEALGDFSLVPYHTDRYTMDTPFLEIPKHIKSKTKHKTAKSPYRSYQVFLWHQVNSDFNEEPCAE